MQNTTIDLCLQSAEQAMTRMQSGTLTASALMDAILERIERYNPALNAIVTLDATNARRQAAQQQAAHPKSGPLCGLPFTVKDIWQTQGLRSTAGHPAFKDFVPERDAAVVARLRKAGAILVGKTNLAEMAGDSQTDNPLFGRTNNPWDTARTPGGSSGGGAAAVAAGLSFLDVGNDMLGSVRIPAHFCGLCGFVPTSGTVPASGSLLPPVDSHMLRQFVRPGFLARDVETLETAWRATAGPDDENRDLFAVDVREHGTPTPQKLGMAWSWQLDHLPLDNAVRCVLEKWRAEVAAAGVSVTDLEAGTVPFPDASDAFLNLFLPATALRLPPAIRALARLGGSHGLHTDLGRVWAAERKRDDALCRLDQALAQAGGILACPVAAVPAYPHQKPDGRMGFQPIYRKGLPVNGKPENYATVNVGYTVPFTVTGNPVLVLPAGLSAEGLPVGVQLVGRRFRDTALLAAGRALMAVVPFNLHPPVAE